MLHVPGLGHRGAGGRGDVGVGLVVHHRDLGVLLRLEEDGVELGEDETAELDNTGEREGVQQRKVRGHAALATTATHWALWVWGCARRTARSGGEIRKD